MSEWKTKRFWKQAHVQRRDEGFVVLLDERKLLTPGKAELVMPTEEMAQAVAAEWDEQPKVVNPLTMPVTRSANSAIDKVASQRAEVAEMVASYGGTDMICYRAESPDGLVKRQADAWDPLLSWSENHLHAPLITAKGIVHVAQSDSSLNRLSTMVSKFTDFELTGFHDLVGLSGSLIIGFAAIHGFQSPEILWNLSRVDEQWQVDQWGEDEEATAMAGKKRDGFLHAHRFFGLSQILSAE